MATVIRVVRKSRDFTMLTNELIRDSRLSMRARGVLVYLLSQADGWSTDAKEIARQSPGEGRDAILRAMKELEQVGYLSRDRVQGERGRWSTVVTVREEPQVTPKTDFQASADADPFADPDPFTEVGSTESGLPDFGPADFGPADVGPAEVGGSGPIRRTLKKDLVEGPTQKDPQQGRTENSCAIELSDEASDGRLFDLPSQSSGSVGSKKRKPTEAEMDAEFEVWWSAYPRKRGRKAAEKSWRALRVDRVTVEDLTVARDRYVAEIQAKGTELEFVKHGSTFLAGAWLDFAPGQGDTESGTPSTKGYGFEKGHRMQGSRNYWAAVETAGDENYHRVETG